MEALGKAYFFRDLSADELGALQSATRIRSARKDEVLLRRGAATDTLSIVRSGSVRVTLSDPTTGELMPDPEHTLVVLGPGECFGEFAFVDRQPASASIVACEDSSLYDVSHKDLDHLLATRPAMATKVYRSLLEVLVRRIRNADIEIAMRKALGD